MQTGDLEIKYPFDTTHGKVGVVSFLLLQEMEAASWTTARIVKTLEDGANLAPKALTTHALDGDDEKGARFEVRLVIAGDHGCGCVDHHVLFIDEASEETTKELLEATPKWCKRTRVPGLKPWCVCQSLKHENPEIVLPKRLADGSFHQPRCIIEEWGVCVGRANVAYSKLKQGPPKQKLKKGQRRNF